MSKCNISIPYSGPADMVVEKARKEVQRYGFFQGDSSHGNFEIKVLGTINGSYTISGQMMNIMIDTKPIFLSCNKIEQFMSQNFL